MESQSDQGLEEHIAGPCLSSEEDFMAQYTIEKAIGQGSFGLVNLAHHNLTGIPVAVKFLRRENQRDELIRTEVEVMKKLHHPNIVTLMQVVETDETVYLAMELVQGQTVFDNVIQFGCMEEHHARKIFTQALSALCYCHERGVAHRDIKPDNIMVTCDGTVKLIDFGLSATFTPGQMVECFCGALEYIPPECYGNQLCDLTKIDTWQLGITLYFIVTGIEPFQGENIYRLMGKIINGIYYIPDCLSAELRDLICQTLTGHPKQRPALKSLRGHPWVAQGSPVRAHYDDTMSRLPDPKIMAALAAIGIRRADVEDALLQDKYNDTQALYKILQARLRQNIKVLAEPVDPEPTPWPSLSHPATFPLTLQHAVSMPSLQGSLTKKKQNKRMRNVRILPEHSTSQACMQALSQACMQTLLPPNTAPQRPPTAPCMDMAQSPKAEAETAMLPEGTVKEDGPLCTEAQQTPSAASQGRPRRGMIWARRIWRTICNLCCCVPCNKRQKRRP